MAISDSITNPVSGGEKLTGEAVLGENVDLGTLDIAHTGEGNNISVNAILASVDSTAVTANVNDAWYHRAVKDRVGSDPSGYNGDGTVDFGDGQQEIETVWNTDDHDIISYFKPLRPNVTDYETSSV